MKLRTLATLGALAVASIATTASAQSYRFLESWTGAQEAGAKLIEEQLIPEMKSVLDADVMVFGPETVPPFEQFEPLRAGAFDFLYTNPIYHFGETRGATFAEAFTATGAERREAGIWDLIDEHYADLGVKVIAMITTPGGYHVVTSKPLAEGSLEGLTIRGTPNYQGVVDYLGGSLVVIPTAETYTALERGVVDGGILPMIATRNFGWNEVAPNMVRPLFGTVITYVFMNLDKFNALPEDKQTALVELGYSFTETADAAMRELSASEQAALEEAGSVNVELSEELSNGLAAAFADPLYAAGMEMSPETTEKMKELASEAGFLD